jgi:hypothetical protein
MGERLEKILKLFFSNKKVLLLSLGLILFLSLVPLHFAQANIFSDILNGIKNLPISIPTLIIVVPLFVITAVVGTLSTILSQIMIVFVRATMSIGVTPANQEIVRIGWEVSRDIVNLLFILILVFIGLATILRLQTYQAQKTLPLLIIIALLVNFSGVIVGFIVDLGNLVTNFFLSYTANFSTLGHTLADIGGSILDMITAEGATIFSQASGLILQVIVSFFYFLIMILVLFVVLLIFFTRVVILWILAILAPIAFASYILPATKKFWTQWWQQLIQWSIISIPISFFLFLSSKLLEKLSVAGGDPFQKITGDPTLLHSLTVVPGLDVFFADILGKVAALAMLMVGIMLSMQMAPAGAQGIINFGKRASKWGGLKAGTALGRRISPKVEAWGKRLAERGERPGEEKGIFAKALGKTVRFGERWTGRTVGLGAGALYRQVKTKDEDEINAGKKEATNKDSADNFRIINEELAKGRLANWNRIAGLLVGTRENGDGDDIEKAFQEGGALASHAPKLKKIIEAGQRAGPPGYRPLVKALFGHIITNPKAFGYNADYDEKTGAFTGDEKDIKTLKEFKEKIPEKMTAQDFQGNAIAPKNFDPNTPEGRFFIQTMLRERGADFMPQFARRPKRSEREALMQYIFKQGKFAKSGLGEAWLVDNGAEDVLRYMDSPGARSAGIGMAKTRQEIENLIAEKMSGKEDEELKKEKGELMARLEKARREGRRERGLRKVRDQIARIDKELTLRSKTRDELVQEIKDKMKRKLEIDAIKEENMTADLYKELAEIEEVLRRDNTELKRRKRPIVEAELPTLEPSPSKRELKEFRAIAEGIKTIPRKGKAEKILRKIRGSLIENLKLQKEVAEEIKSVEKLIKETGATDALNRKMADLQGKLEVLHKKEGELKTKENQIEIEETKKENKTEA